MKPWPQEPLDRHKIWESSFSTTWNHHTSWSQYLRRTGIGAHRFEYPEHAKELPSFISFGYQIHVMALFAHQNCLSSIAKSGSGVLLRLRQVAVPRRPARQFPVSARSTPSLQNKFNGKKKTLQYGWFCVSDLQDVDKNRMPKIIQNHLEFVWTGFSLRIYLFWIRSCCVCSFAMAITRNMGKFHKPKGCTATTGAFQRVCEKIPVTAAGVSAAWELMPIGLKHNSKASCPCSTERQGLPWKVQNKWIRELLEIASLEVNFA